MLFFLLENPGYISILVNDPFLQVNLITKYEGIDYNTISEEFGETYYSPVNMIPANKEDEFWDNKDNSQASQSQVGEGGEPQ